MEASRTEEREAMVTRQIEHRGVRDPRVLDAMRRVPRHAFVPADVLDEAYADRPLAIGLAQTISQPFIVGLMTELARIRAGSNVLEIGTGCGYQTAVLAEMGAKVCSIEIIEPLAERARHTLDRLGYRAVETRIGDGYRGWPERAPFDAILVAAAPAEIPQPLLDQLAIDGRLVVPVGVGVQDLVVVTRNATGFDRKFVEAVRFVPMTGEAERVMHAQS